MRKLSATGQHWDPRLVDDRSRRRVRPTLPGPGVGRAKEVGTNRETIVQADLATARQQFFAAAPDLDESGLVARASDIFVQVQTAWSEGDLSQVRHSLTSSLNSSHNFFLRPYTLKRWRNRLDNVRVTDVQLCRFDQDEHYQLFTARIFASLNDYLVDQSGNVVPGSGKEAGDRGFSEYWTFQRRNGSQDWKLSGIDQDENYDGGIRLDFVAGQRRHGSATASVPVASV